jgi:hypothetical protein
MMGQITAISFQIPVQMRLAEEIYIGSIKTP